MEATWTKKIHMILISSFRFHYIRSKNVVYYCVASEVLVEQGICIHVQSFFSLPSSNVL